MRFACIWIFLNLRVVHEFQLSLEKEQKRNHKISMNYVHEQGEGGERAYNLSPLAEMLCHTAKCCCVVHCSASETRSPENFHHRAK